MQDAPPCPGTMILKENEGIDVDLGNFKLSLRDGAFKIHGNRKSVMIIISIKHLCFRIQPSGKYIRKSCQLTSPNPSISAVRQKADKFVSYFNRCG